MKFQTILAGACLPALALSFPGMLGASKEDMLRQMQAREAAEAASKAPEKRQLLSFLTATLATIIGDVTGLLGSVASSVDPSNKRPQAGYTFQAPAATDSRGPCPGLNLLANYGYLPRNGYVTLSQVVAATAEGFNMGADLATILSVFAVLTDGDIATESWYLGAGPSNVGGLNRHSTVEADISPNREDYYLGCGDNHHVSSRLFKQNVGYVIEGGTKQFDIAAMTKQYVANSKFSQKYNPYLYYFPFPSIVSLGAFVFYPNFFSNGTYGAGGVANYESISSIIGASFNSKTGNWEYVPEKWPTNWYRRATEFGAVDTVTENIALYEANPVGMPFGQLGTANLNATTVLCDIYQGLNSITPLQLGATEESAAAALAWALGVLDPYFSDTILGCPTTDLSPNLYTNSSVEGGPLNTPPSVTSNDGNNVYNKTYFTATPSAPLCSHVSS